MKKLYAFFVLLILFSLIPVSVHAQISFWTETFSTGSAARGTLANGYPSDQTGNWTQTNIGPQGSFANEWYVSGEECGNNAGACGAACPNGDASLHIGSVANPSIFSPCPAGDCGAAYDATDPSNITRKRIESPLISSTGLGIITLNLNFIAMGEPGVDFVTVVFSDNGGTTWTPLSTLTGQCCCLLPGFCGGPDPIPCAHVFSGQGYWTSASVILPASANNNGNVKIGFEWVNDGNGIGSDPSIAIDDIDITRDVILPVSLEKWNVRAIKNAVSLQWKTSSERDNESFLVEKSADGIQFEILKALEGTQSPSYETVDPFPYWGANYYRLIQLDQDGNPHYSDVRAVYFEEIHNEITVLPNPASEHSILTIRYVADELDKLTVRMLDITGKEIRTNAYLIDKMKNEFTFPLDGISKGMYFLRFKQEKEARVRSRKLVVD